MPIWSKRVNPRQRKALARYENISGFEPMHMDEFDAKKMSFWRLWNLNIAFLEMVLADVTNTDLRGCTDDECPFDTNGDGDCHRCVHSPRGCSEKP